MVTHKPIALLRNPLPRPEVDFVDANRFFLPLLGLSFLHPFVVTPFEPVKVENKRRSLNSMLAEKPAWIALQHDLTKAIPDLEFIVGSFHNPWDKKLPNARLYPSSHRMASPIPSVKISNYADSLSIWRPNRKSATGMTVYLGQVSAKLLINLVMVSLLVQMHIQFTKNCTVGIGIAEL